MLDIDVASEKYDCIIIDSATSKICEIFRFENYRYGFNVLMPKITLYSAKKDFSDMEIGLESTSHYSNNHGIIKRCVICKNEEFLVANVS